MGFRNVKGSGRFIGGDDLEERKREKERSKAKEGPSDGNALWRMDKWFSDVPTKTLDVLKIFQTELLKFNGKLNLISRNTERESDELHFADSVFAVRLLQKEKLPKRLFDIGSGNGFPGLVLALFEPAREVHLVESDGRKAEFMKHAAQAMGLKNVTVLNVRFESLREAGIEAALSRGFASISKTLLVSNRVFAEKGVFYHLKGPNWSSEVADLPSQILSVWVPRLVGEYTLSVSQSSRAIVATQKAVGSF